MPPASFTTSTPSSLQRALAAIQRGEVILFPTETVYGLGVDSSNAAAVDSLYELKGRPKIKPFQWLISDVALARATSAWSSAAEKLAAAFWPGPLTLVVQLSSNAEETRGWRIPDHAWVLELLRKLGRPLVATSANRAGEPAALNFEEAMKTIGNEVSVAVDGGQVRGGQASTVASVVHGKLEILREGALSKEQLLETLG